MIGLGYYNTLTLKRKTDFGWFLEDEEETDIGPKFKVLIMDAKPAGCKISKKNTCIVEIRKEELEEKGEEENLKLLHYYTD